MIMAYKEKLKKELHLISVDERLKCYLLTKKVWLMFWEENIQKNNMEEILHKIETSFSEKQLISRKTIIIMGNTIDDFHPSDLVWFNGMNMYVVFYLINEKNSKTYRCSNFFDSIGWGYRKWIKKIDFILSGKA